MIGDLHVVNRFVTFLAVEFLEFSKGCAGFNEVGEVLVWFEIFGDYSSTLVTCVETYSAPFTLTVLTDFFDKSLGDNQNYGIS